MEFTITLCVKGNFCLHGRQRSYGIRRRVLCRQAYMYVSPSPDQTVRFHVTCHEVNKFHRIYCLKINSLLSVRAVPIGLTGMHLQRVLFRLAQRSVPHRTSASGSSQLTDSDTQMFGLSVRLKMCWSVMARYLKLHSGTPLLSFVVCCFVK